MFRFKSIRTKLTMWILLLSLVPLLVVTSAIQIINSKSLIAGEEASMQELVNSKSDSIARWFLARTAEMEIAAESDIMKSLDPSRIIPFLTTLDERSEVFETMFVLDTDGIVIAHTKPESIGSDYSDRSYYPTTLEGEASYSDVLISKATGNRIVVSTTPIRNAEGDVIAILAGSANFEVLINTYLAFEEGGIRGEIILVDGSGVIQLDNSPDNIGKTLEEASLNEELKKIITASQTSADVVSIEKDGNKQLLAYAPIDVVGYGLSIHTPEDTVLAEAHKLQYTTMAIIILTALVITAIAYTFIRFIIKPITAVTAGMNQVAQGNLTIDPLPVSSKDELGQLSENFNKMVVNTKNLVVNIQATADQVATSSEQLTESTNDTVAASEQISASVQTIASSAEQQASYTEDVKSVVTGISQGITLITNNIDETNNVAHHAVDVASSGTTVIHKTVTQMERVVATTDAATATINHLGSKSSEIDKIIAVITSIADQTNLLALNAAIEAARAGEYGKGFAVVADEVRKLAEQSAQASGQIGQLIKEIQLEIHSSIEAMNEGTEAVTEGTALVASAGEAFQDIARVVNNVSDHMMQIHEESARIQTHAGKMVEDIEHITEISISTSSNTQEIASASEEQNSSMTEMASMANTLSDMAAELRQAAQAFQVK